MLVAMLSCSAAAWFLLSAPISWQVTQQPGTATRVWHRRVGVGFEGARVACLAMSNCWGVYDNQCDGCDRSWSARVAGHQLGTTDHYANAAALETSSCSCVYQWPSSQASAPTSCSTGGYLVQYTAAASTARRRLPSARSGTANRQTDGDAQASGAAIHALPMDGGRAGFVSSTSQSCTGSPCGPGVYFVAKGV